MKKLKNIKLIIFIVSLTMVSGCRGWKTDKAPVHPNINFDFQAKIKAQRKPLPIPANTMQYSTRQDTRQISDFYVDEAFIKNGQKNYNIYCSACHTKTGNGTKSVVSQSGWIVSNILEDTTYQRSDDSLYDIIKNGIRSMPGYDNKLNNKEIWQVVVYVRALQKMDRATNSEIKSLDRGTK